MKQAKKGRRALPYITEKARFSVSIPQEVIVAIGREEATEAISNAAREAADRLLLTIKQNEYDSNNK